ncbi:MAG: pre-peptidase C-terminal domain-containing protein [Methanomassiliicoccales archaeon]|nr:pre-peptidase C-terminal domain-containing protein [Methanomassiliicoccales archaeon]
MVIAAFYVMGSDVRAETAEFEAAEALDQRSSIEHADRRLTISNKGASAPCIGVQGDTTHVLWVDGEEGAKKLAWKRSNDSLSTYTADRTITPFFHSISNIEIVLGSSFSVAVLFQGQKSPLDGTSVYFLYMDDSDEWSNCLALSAGSGPSAASDGSAVYLLMNALFDGVERTSLASIALVDGEVNASFLAALPIAAVNADMSFRDGVLDIALIDDAYDRLLYLQIGTNGTLIADPSLVYEGCDGGSVEIIYLKEKAYIVFIDENAIKMARCLGDPSSWTCHTVLEAGTGSISALSISSSGPMVRIAYVETSNEGSSVWVVRCDQQGNAHNKMQISTPGLSASFPVVFTTYPGSFSCAYSEEHFETQELFVRHDMDFSIADISRLPDFIDSLDPVMFADGNGTRAEIKGHVNVIISHLDNRDDAMAVESATALMDDLGSFFVYAPYDNLVEVEGTRMTIAANLATVGDPSGSASIMSLSDPFDPPGGTIIYESVFVFDVFEALSNTTFNVQWHYQLGGWGPMPIIGDSGHLMWGTSGSNMTIRVNGSLIPDRLSIAQYRYNANITGLSSNTTYYLKGYVIDGTITYSSTIRAFTPYPNVLNIGSISVSTGTGTATISWSTNVKSDSRIDYGTTTSYGNHLYYDDPVWSHSLNLNNLGSNTLYHFKITSVLSTPTYYIANSTSDLTFTSMSISLTISSVACTLSDLNVATITWTTNIAASSVVYYGTTANYGSSAGGPSGTSHSVSLSGLLAGTTYHFKVRSVATASSSVQQESGGHTFTTIPQDADLGIDAGDSIGEASLLAPGNYVGYLDASLDTNDYYSLPLLNGERISISLDVPSGADYDLYLYNPSDVQKASSTSSSDETISYTINANGAWKVRVAHQSGSGQGSYGLDVRLFNGWEEFSLNVGSSGDNDVLSHTPGMVIIDGTGWCAVSGGMRETTANGSYYLNVYDGTYQVSTYYQVTISYTSSADVGVSILVGNDWVQVAALPGRTAAWAHSFVLKSDMLHDSSSALIALNARLRFDHQVIVDHISAIPVAYASDLFSGSQNHPGTVLGDNWQIGNAVVNGSNLATILVSIPRTDVQYFLEFMTTSPCSGVGVQQWDGAAYDNIGTLEGKGTSAVIHLDPASYFDTSSTNPGMNLRLRLSAPLINLTRIVLWTSQSSTDVGGNGDTDPEARTHGVSILSSGWSSPLSIGNAMARRTTSNTANFQLNGALSDVQYILTITYRATSGTTYLQQFQGADYGNYLTLGSLTVDGAWHTTRFVTSPLNMYDATSGGPVNLQFRITNDDVLVDTISVCRDTDGDTISDALESLRITQSSVGTHAYDLNPFSADTDSDGLNDNVERSTSYNTDPCDPDTDSDGLLDGSERYSYTWSTDDSYLIPDDNTWLNIPISVPAIQGGASAITSLCLVLGIMHDSQYQLEIKIAKGTDTQKTIKAAYSGSGANYFILRNLFVAASPFTSPYTAADLSTGAEWHIYVRDATPGTQGRVEYARLQVNGTTNPLDNDSDDDLILDGEEVEFGTDGWYTNPRASDSDSDGVSDRNEILGTTQCGSATDPTRADTDDDGYNDNIDRYMGDAVLRVTIMEYKTREDVNIGDDDCNIFFVIRYGDQELSTKRLDAHTDVLYYPGWAYDIDIEETTTSVDLEILAVADNAVITGDDEKLDVSPSGNLDHDVTWDMVYNSTTLSFQGSKDTFDHDTDAYMKVKLERAVTEKAKVIVIHGTGDDGDYGLDAVSTSVYRYSADDQVYMINLNVSNANGRFQQGMNTIILPRAIALQCQLNDTLYDLQNVASSPLNGASFYSTNVSSASASGHIIAVISHDVSASETEDILFMLTHNATYGRIGNNVTISSTALYLLHLPSDILSAIPTSVMNAGMGPGPSFPDPLDTICDIAGMVFDFLVWVATGGVLLLLAHLLKEGLKAISKLVSTAITAVEAAVDRIVDAFLAFVDWAIEFIGKTIDVILGPIVDAIEEMYSDYCHAIYGVMTSVISDFNDDGSVSPHTSTQLLLALQGGMYLLIFGIALSIEIVLLALTAITNIFSILIGFAVSLIGLFILQQSFGIGADQTDESAYKNSISSFASSDQTTNTSAVNDYIENTANQNNGTYSSIWFNLGGFICSMVALQFTEASIGQANKITKLSAVALTTGIISCALGFFALVALTLN